MAIMFQACFSHLLPPLLLLLLCNARQLSKNTQLFSMVFVFHASNGVIFATKRGPDIYYLLIFGWPKKENYWTTFEWILLCKIWLTKCHHFHPLDEPHIECVSVRLVWMHTQTKLNLFTDDIIKPACIVRT